MTVGCPPGVYVGSLNPNWRGGKSTHPLYWTYRDMVARCTRPSHARWADYGGRGITVCQRWRDDFWTYVADVGVRPPGTCSDRIDNDGNYEPGNFRWATLQESAVNRRAQALDGFRRTSWAGNIRPGPKSHCPEGHPYDEANTYISPDGGRHCRICRRVARRRHARKKTAA